MRFLWLDTETTGLEVTDSSVFEIGLILVDNGRNICERCFFLNPLSETIKYHDEAGKIHGYTEEQIKSFPAEKEHAAFYLFAESVQSGIVCVENCVI